MSSIPAGWYPDPTNPLQERLWDGDEWMEKTRPRQPQVSPTPPASTPATMAAPTYAPVYTPTYVPTAEPERSTFGGAVREGFSKFADFDGRSSVSAYWNFWLFSVVATIGSLLLGPLAVLVFILFLFPSLSFAVRRLHDRGKSGAYLLLGLVPIIGTLIVLIELAGSGDAGPNQYGQQPGVDTGAVVNGPVGGAQQVARQTPQMQQTFGQGPAGGVILYDTGIPGDPNRYLEVAPMGWNRTPDDPMWTWDEAMEFFGTDPAAMAAGWRLPTADEIAWFGTRKKMIPGLRRQSIYWTSDTHGKRKALTLLTSYGEISRARKASTAQVRPVRSLGEDGRPSGQQRQAPSGRTLSPQLEPPAR